MRTQPDHDVKGISAIDGKAIGFCALQSEKGPADLSQPGRGKSSVRTRTAHLRSDRPARSWAMASCPVPRRRGPIRPGDRGPGKRALSARPSARALRSRSCDAVAGQAVQAATGRKPTGFVLAIARFEHGGDEHAGSSKGNDYLQTGVLRGRGDINHDRR
jgi:hypothetical protein